MYFLRPPVGLVRPMIRCPISLHQGLSLNTLYVGTGKTRHASTALDTAAREREENVSGVKAVGNEMIGVEGPHYQGMHLESGCRMRV
jgi:hypothetical protein